MSITKEYANKILDEYRGDMFDDILVSYVLENLDDQEFIKKLGLVSIS